MLNNIANSHWKSNINFTKQIHTCLYILPIYYFTNVNIIT